MPTSYTAKIADNISFRDFVLTCARAFGACVEQRDDDMGEKPKLKKLDVFYHENAIKDAKAKLKLIKEYTDSEIKLLIDKEFKNKINSTKKSLRENTELMAKYNKMLEAVKSWSPPTSDHEGLKKFMIEQIESSIKFDCNSDYYNRDLKKKKLTVGQYKKQLIDQTNWNIAYHTTGIEKEIKNVETSNKWITALYNSLH